jgi:mRNA interferase RelE/StbE
MAWKVELSSEAVRELDKLDAQPARRILKFLHERVANLDDPRTIGQALRGSRLGEFWKYRVEDYRLICRIEDAQLLVLVLRVGPRREIYR